MYMILFIYLFFFFGKLGSSMTTLTTMCNNNVSSNSKYPKCFYLNKISKTQILCPIKFILTIITIFLIKKALIVFVFYFQKLVFGSIKKKKISCIFEIKNMFG